MKKLITILALVVLMFGVVSADRTLYNPTDINFPLENIIAGNTFQANFSFGYLDVFPNTDNSPLIIQLNFTSGNLSYPVWKNDFEVSGRVKKYAWYLPRYLRKTIEFNCSEEYEQTIEHPLDSQIVQAENGTFYCYNSAGDLELEEYDEVYLDITSHHALYPGEYDLTASMFYLTDERAPFVEITNKDAFDLYYRENDKVSVFANITDGSEITQIYGEAYLENETILFTNPVLDEELYYFQEDTPEDIQEGDYSLFIFAKDEHNNMGNDSVMLKIDLTAPNITLVSPANSSIYNDAISVKLNVTDTKSGVDNSSVYYRISEIMPGLGFCPFEGILFGIECYNSGWMATELNISGYYEDEFDATNVTSGSYYFEAKAEDILGNEGILK